MPSRQLRHASVLVMAAVLAASPVVPAVASASPAAPASPASVAKAYTFLDQMMDLHATGTTPRLVQSFTGGVLGRQHFTDSETYDDALVIDAFLAEGTADGLSRAETIGNGLLYVPAHDPKHDGRIRAAYAPTPLTQPSDVHITDATSDVGNMAWTGMALAQLHQASGNTAYLTGAESIGTWIVANCRDTRGAGGYTGGQAAGGASIRWKSTEHNIDLYGMFSMLATETGDSSWSADAAWARQFVVAMWRPGPGEFYVGTTANGVTPNKSEQPEDVNSWSYLALRDPSYAASMTWDVRHLSVSAGKFSGVSFCLGAKNGVWFEGTAHLADALEFRDGSGDAAQAATYLSDIAYAQAHGPNNDGLGIIAASINKLSDCDGDYYYASLHTGATAWYIMASRSIDPFTLFTGSSAT